MKQFLGNLFRSLTGRSRSCPAARPTRRIHLQVEALEERAVPHANLNLLGYWLEAGPGVLVGHPDGVLIVTSENYNTGQFTGLYRDFAHPLVTPVSVAPKGMPVTGQLSPPNLFGWDPMSFKGSLKYGHKLTSPASGVSFQGYANEPNNPNPGLDTVSGVFGGKLTESALTTLGRPHEVWSTDVTYHYAS
jgi:hypothetical protein